VIGDDVSNMDLVGLLLGFLFFEVESKAELSDFWEKPEAVFVCWLVDVEIVFSISPR
jgi:hypothetical protein